MTDWCVIASPRKAWLGDLRYSRALVAGGGGGVHGVVVGLLEDHILDEGLGHNVLLLHLAVLVLLTDDDTLSLGLEEHAARGDGGGTAVLLLGDTDAGETDLEDADAGEVDLLAELEVVLHGLAQLSEHGDDVASLHTGLRLDVVGQVLGLDELAVVHGLGVVLAVGSRLGVLVLTLDKLL